MRETEFVLVTQFGQPLYTVTDAGPAHEVVLPDVHLFRPAPAHLQSAADREFLTRDKKNVVIENYVAWKIDDPKRFVETVGDPVAAEMRLHDIVWSGLSAALGTHDLESIVSTEPRNVKADTMLDRLDRR